MIYKINDEFLYQYQKGEKQFRIGQYVRAEDIQFVVEESDPIQATGKVINTYGHKRRK